MLRLIEAVIVVLIVLWAIGLFLRLFGGLIHILLIVALIAIVFRYLQGRSTTP